MDVEEQLRARPTFEQASQDYVALLTEITAAITAVSPTVKWPGTPPQPGPSACAAPFTKVTGASQAEFDFLSANGGSTGVAAIPDADWPRVRTTFTDIAKKHGFTTVKLDIDKPGRHELTLGDQYGASVQLGTIEGTSLGLSGACFLDAAHHSAS